jgi:general L-amino acid transport system permease protein
MSFLRNNRVAGVLLQMVFTGVVIWLGYLLFRNTQSNLEARNIASGFDFLSVEAGFPISNSLIPYSPAKSYGYALAVGILNTLYVAVLGIVAASAIGVLIGVARVSRNWLVSRLAATYVEILRNVPLLLILFFTYGVVLVSLPPPRASLNPFWGCFLNNRGLYLPRPVFQSGFGIVALCAVLGVVAAVLFGRWAARHRVRTGRVLPSGRIAAAMVIGLPAAAFALCGGPLAWEKALLQGFNFQGGTVLRPEFTALMLGLVLYTAAFIGENVRSGIQSVGRGQLEAAHSLGVNRAVVMRRVVLPQALRVILPATTNDYTSLVKNSSLAVAIGYPDMVSVGGTIIGQNDQAIEIIGLWMAVYLAINLIVSVLMNWVNAKVQIVER